MFFSHIPGHSFTQGRISQISRCNLEDISFLQGGGKLANNILFRDLSSCKSWSESKDASHNKVLRFTCFTGEKSIAFQKVFRGLQTVDSYLTPIELSKRDDARTPPTGIGLRPNELIATMRRIGIVKA